MVEYNSNIKQQGKMLCSCPKLFVIVKTLFMYALKISIWAGVAFLYYCSCSITSSEQVSTIMNYKAIMELIS